MKRIVLNKRGKIAVAVASLLLGALSIKVISLNQTENYEVRTMYVYGENEEKTYLIDGNGEVYAMNEKVGDGSKALYVKIDNKGTENLKDDEIISWAYRY